MIRQRIGWAAYILIILTLGALPYVFELPTPEGAIQVTKATFTPNGGVAERITLPHRWSSADRTARVGIYEIYFELDAVADAPLYLFIPALKKSLEIELDGTNIFDSSVRHSWSGPLIQATGLALLPTKNLKAGRNHLRLTLYGEAVLPGYLSALYIGDKKTVSPHFKIRVFINERLKAMMFSAQTLMFIGILVAYLYRREERVFGWFSALLGLTMPFGAGLFADLAPAIMDAFPYVFVLGSSVGCVTVLFALSLIGRQEPRFLVLAIVAIPAISLVLFAAGVFTWPQLTMTFSIPILIVGFMSATAITAWGAFYEKRGEAALVLGPLALIASYMVHDMAMARGYIEGIGFIAQDARPLLLAVITVVLMRRLSISLNKLDKNEETLQGRLTTQKAELDAYFTKERKTSERAVLETERRRLVSDLHDGMGGHLVSIIALSDGPNTQPAHIHAVARSALDDLRMVIYSLDISGDDLPFALASYRERLLPVLRSLNIETEWSMAALPEIHGASPGNVLVILRILQEAVTNAKKHGTPRKIRIIGLLGSNGAARLIVENTGGTPLINDGANGGYGLNNMRNRAQTLGGVLNIEALSDGARLTLELPLTLPHI
ncbi:MAG: hypothetical protein JKY27_08740 [Magnetovibrio sp.]|nr:hypothetical protein [Magnetovibrio sp.]